MNRYLPIFIIVLFKFYTISCSHINTCNRIVDYSIFSDSKISTRDISNGLLINKNTILSMMSSLFFFSSISDNYYENLDSSPVKKNMTLKQVVQNVYSSVATFFSKNIVRMLLFTIVIIMIFAVINHFIKNADEKKFLSNNRLSVMDKEIKIACNYMEKNFRDPELSVSSMCEALVTGAAFLEVLFNNELGMSVDNFLTQVRMNRALEIIKKEDTISIDDLILRIGYTNSKDFSNSFEKVTGKSFSEFQRTRNLG